ncbi:MAG TPA: DUF1080 domain-containing protein [Anseongella sp.]|nr:DUF1080 domain-containing protein [Anseongella sp.]
MRNIFLIVPLMALMSCNAGKRTGNPHSGSSGESTKGWISLFDGHSFKDWKAGENPGTFSIEDGAIVVNGPRAHLFYVGDVSGHDFRNFEFRARVMTTPGSNSGIYFHTKFQQERFPDDGFEVQVNNSHGDWKRTGSLYDIVDIAESYAKDNEWYTQYIRVEGKKVTIKVNGKTAVEWTEAENAAAPEGHPGRLISGGTFALQGHDPKSKVYFKDLQVRILPD